MAKLSPKEAEVYIDLFDGRTMLVGEHLVQERVHQIRKKFGPDSVINDPELTYTLGNVSGVSININTRKITKVD